MSGRVIGVADVSGHCANGYLSVADVLRDIAATPQLATNRDVMLVLDRSGSMSLDDGTGTGTSKILAARDAASLFVQLIRSGAGDKIGMVSFSTVPSLDFVLSPVNAAAKSTLIGPGPPFTAGVVGAINPGGLTTIGGGLEVATGQFPAPGANVNQRTILLMTDGLQNTPPMVANAEPLLVGCDLSVVGFGAESNLDGVLLDHLAQEHNGMYTRAGSGLQLKKFFVLAFGNIFESGTLSDPEYDLTASQSSKSIPFQICGEDTITAVLGWDRADASLLIQLKSPGGAIINTASPGVASSAGRTWTFLRVTLPFAGERDGAWEAQVFRPAAGELAPPAVALRFFVNVVVKGGPSFVRLNPARKYYTGDKLNPLVRLRNKDGTTPRNADAKLIVTTPANSAGNVLSRAKLGPPTTVGGDVIPPRQSTLIALEKANGQAAISYVDQKFDLFDDGGHEDGAMEPDGIFGNPLADLLKTEGTYTFRAVATYGDQCVATREALWSIHVDVGVDPGHTDINVNLTGTRPDGQRTGTVTITPRDAYGNNLGPGRGTGFTVTGVPGTTITGPVKDNGDGTYTVPIASDPASGHGPGVVVGQPDRPPVVVAPKPKDDCRKWKSFTWFLFILVLILLILLLVK